MVGPFPTHVAFDAKVSATTHNEPRNVLLFLYREVYEAVFPWLDDGVRTRRPRHLPVE